MSITSQFQSTLPVWGGTIFPQAQGKNTVISIHPPRVGRDVDQHPLAYPQGISIHPPRVGRDVGVLKLEDELSVFQSTLPVWGGASLNSPPIRCTGISIHPPRVGRDMMPLPLRLMLHPFQSTLPVWGGTAKVHKNSL